MRPCFALENWSAESRRQMMKVGKLSELREVGAQCEKSSSEDCPFRDRNGLCRNTAEANVFPRPSTIDLIHARPAGIPVLFPSLATGVEPLTDFCVAPGELFHSLRIRQ